jgi:hypothetical protein
MGEDSGEGDTTKESTFNGGVYPPIPYLLFRMSLSFIVKSKNSLRMRDSKRWLTKGFLSTKTFLPCKIRPVRLSGALLRITRSISSVPNIIFWIA